MNDGFQLDESKLSAMEFPLGKQHRANKPSSVACTQRSKENIKREIDRNLRRKTIDKVMRLSQLCNLDPFHEDTLVIILLLNLKFANKHKLLQRFIECKQEQKIKQTKLRTEKAVAGQGDVGDDSNDYNTADAANTVNAANAVNAANDADDANDKNLQGFDYRILEHLDSVIPDIMNTVTDWLGVLEYVEVIQDGGDRTDMTDHIVRDDSHASAEVNLVANFEASMASAQLDVTCNAAYALIHAYMDNVPSALMLERLFLRSAGNESTASNTGMEMRTLRLLSAFNDRVVVEQSELHDLCSVLMSLRVLPSFFQNLVSMMQEETTQHDTERQQTPTRTQLRLSKLKTKAKAGHSDAENFQAWASQQRFSAVSSKHMQLILYFVTVQTQSIPVAYYEEQYSSIICERMRANTAVHSRIDENAIFQLIKSIRTYSVNIPDLIFFDANCLQCLTQRARQGLSKVQVLQLYIIAFQHETIVQRLWLRMLSEFGHTVQENIKNFRKKHTCDYHGVIQNMFAVHDQNTEFRRKFQAEI